MIKVFPKSRVCAIDCYSAVELGLKDAISFAKINNISLSSIDGRKIILAFCLKHLEHTYKTTQSLYPKVFFMSKKSINKKVMNFIETHFETMMTYLPYSYCGKYDSESPDLEAAAESSLSRRKTQRKFKQFATKMGIKPSYVSLT